MTPLRLLPWLAAALLTACATERPAPGSVATGGDVCRTATGHQAAAQRAAFALDFPEAEARLRALLALQDETPAAAACPGALSPAAALAELGLVLSSQRQYRLADANFAEAREALALMPGGTDAEQAARRLAEGRVGVLEAQHALNRQEFATARDLSRAAMNRLGPVSGGQGIDLGGLIELDSGERDRRLVGLTGYFTESAALARAGDPAGARTAIESAIAVAGALPGATGAIQSRLMAEQALIAIEAGDTQTALARASAAAAQLATELPGTPLAGRARLIEGAVLAQAGREAEAFAAFDSAFTTYAETPAALQYETIWPYIRLALTANAAGRLSDAALAEGVFRAAQLVRSASAAGDIAQTAALVGTGDDAAAAAVRDWRAAQDELLLLTTALSRRDLQPTEREALNGRFARAAEREAQARARRDRIAPAYRRAIETPTTLAEVQATLRPGEAMLLVLVGTPRTTLLLIEPDGARVETSVIDAALATQLTQLLREPMERRADSRYATFPVALAHDAYTLLFEALGEGLRAPDKLFVVATGPLQGLPFEMLVTDNPAGLAPQIAREDYTGVAWLGAQTTLSYLPSARSLVDLRGAAGQSAADRSLIGFGDFRPPANPAAAIDARRRATCGPEIALLGQLPPLPGTASELAQISNAFGEGIETVTGDAFTEDAVKALSGQGRLRDFRIVHMATHGLLWNTVDCFEPALSTSVAPGSPEDGLLESSEIRRLALDAQLVVLSACQSTDPEIAEAGENLSGLARAFFSSGARSVIASHWAVDDQQTAALMGAFYDTVARAPATPFSTALAEAQAALRSVPATSHPVFWAPFVVLGEGTLALAPS